MPNQHYHRPFDADLVAELLRQRLVNEQPSEAFRHALYGKLMRQRLHGAVRREMPQWRPWKALHWMSSVVMACLVLLVGTGCTTAYAYLSPTVTRQSSLYALKMVVESAELSLKATPEDRVHALLKFANRRIDELRILSQRGSLDHETLAAIVHNTEEALAQANAINDTAVQADIRALVAKDAAAQRSLLENILGMYDDGTTPSPDTKAAGQGEIILDTQRNIVEDTIQKVSTIEVQALTHNIDTQETSIEPNDLAIAFATRPPDTIDITKPFVMRLVLTSTGWAPKDTATISIDWGDMHGQSENIVGITAQPSQAYTLTHQYEKDGTYFIRITASTGENEWTTANNRLAHSVRVTGATTICTFGEQRCEDDRIVLLCGTTDNGVGWKRDRICLEGMQCQQGQCMPPPCTSTCSTEGNQQCSADGKRAEECKAVGACLQWQTRAICNGACSKGECKAPTAQCGNGRIDTGEQCDDGNTISADGCSSECSKETLCVDSDGGNNATLAGTVRTNREENSDLCENYFTLLEFTCSPKQQAFGSRINCPYGCINGACKNNSVCGNGAVETGEECDDGNTRNADGCSARCTREIVDPVCTDTDGGENAKVQGRVTLQQTSMTDVCASEGTLAEYSCRNNAIVSTTIRCANTCQAGACTPATNLCGNGILESPEQCDDGNVISADGCSAECTKELPCIDSDTGTILAIRGTAWQGSTRATDTCSSATRLQEYFCPTKYSLSSDLFTCDYGCAAGACLPAPVCGNALREGQEQCDDGNVVAGDGCSATCTTE